MLTLSQTTNFRLFRTERVCRRQFRVRWKWAKVLQTGRKRCGKRRNCSLRAISPFPTAFSTHIHQIRNCCLLTRFSLEESKICSLGNGFSFGLLQCIQNYVELKTLQQMDKKKYRINFSTSHCRIENIATNG